MDIIFSPIVALFKELTFEKAILVIILGLFIYMFKKIITKFSTSLNNTEHERNKANEQLIALATKANEQILSLSTNHIAHDIQCHEQVKSAMENQTDAIKEVIVTLFEGRERAVKEHTGIITMINAIDEKLNKKL